MFFADWSMFVDLLFVICPEPVSAVTAICGGSDCCLSWVQMTMVFDFRTFAKILWLGTLGGKCFRFRRAVTTVGMLLMLSMMSVLFAVGKGLDRLFFRRVAATPIIAPLFIVGNPRSGTTFFHSLLAMDEDRFFYIKLWQTLFPSVIQQKIILVLTKFDRCLNGPLSCCVDRFQAWVFHGWEAIHKLRFDRPEECVAIWCLACSTPSAYLLMPFIDRLPEVRFLDQRPKHRRKALTKFYRDALQRQSFVNGASRTYLGKNVFHTGRLRSLLEEFPDMRLVHLVRHPYEAIPSMISMFTKPWQFHSPEIEKASAEYQAMAELCVDYYCYMLELLDEISAPQILTLMYDDVVATPYACVLRVYEHFQMKPDAAFLDRVHAATAVAGNHCSQHHYGLNDFGLDKAWVRSRLQAVFDRYGFGE
jgi:hypothetical protein